MAVIKAGTYKFGQLHWENVFQSLSFISNSTSYLAINAFTDAGGFFINYGQETGFLKGETVYYSLDGNEEWTNTAYTEITLATDQTVSDEFYTWFNAVIEKTLKQSVEQHITDAYTAIGNKSGTIPTQKNLANLAGAIDTISAGVDTSDGNIEPTTVLKGYKGYAKGVAVNGAIETYDGTVEDVNVVYTISNVNSRTTGLTAGGDLRAKFDEPPTSETDFVIRFADTSTDRYIEVKPTTPLTAKKIYVWGYGGGGDSDSNGLFVVDNLNSYPRQVIANGKLVFQRVSYNNAEMYEFTQDEYNILFSHDAYDD